MVSFVPGRIRLRFKELKKHLALAQDLKMRVLAIPGITKVEMNPVTGSILIEYDAKVLSTERLIEIGKRELEGLDIKLDIPHGDVGVHR